MSLKRYTGSAWQEIGTVKRYDGTAWREAESVKRWDGSRWVEDWCSDRFVIRTAQWLGPDGKIEQTGGATEIYLKDTVSSSELATYRADLVTKNIMKFSAETPLVLDWEISKSDKSLSPYFEVISDTNGSLKQIYIRNINGGPDFERQTQEVMLPVGEYQVILRLSLQNSSSISRKWASLLLYGITIGGKAIPIVI